MKTLVSALIYGGNRVNAVNLGLGLAAAWLATLDITMVLTVPAAGAAVFLLGREIVVDYLFTSAFLRHARAKDADLRKALDEWTEAEKRKGQSPITEAEVEEWRRKLTDGDGDNGTATAGV